jgi:C4-dicarboxylate-specific signal transduction histidine kinase
MVETTAIRDIDTVIRSIRALSEEIHTTPLVQTLMTIALEHAGAQRGLLIRVKGGSALIEASARLTAEGVAVDTTHSTPGAPDLPLTMLYTAMRMHVPVSVSDSQRPAPYARDPYLVSYPRCAAIIIPMIKHTELVGLLYLENRLSSYGFTGEHTQVLSLLAAQAAISLETASLYAELMEENRVRQRIEKALRESRATLLLGEQINQSGSWSWEVNRGVVTCSAEFRRIFNLDSKVSQFEFASLIQQVYPADRARVERALDEAVAGQRPVRLEHRIVGRDGLLRHLSVVGQPMGEGEADVYVGTVSDITRRKADEDSQRRVQAELARTARMTTVGELTAAIAHEVNQPLMAISASAGASLRWLHRDPPQIGQVETMLHEVVRQSARAGKIIQTLQTLAHRSPQFVDVDLHTLIRQLLAVARSDLDRNDIMVDLNLTAVRSELEGDGIQLQQVFANLIANAVDAMTSLHGPERMLRITSRSVSEGHIEVAVEDNGIGVDEAFLENMFAPFVSTKPDGMGMGLAICRSIVEAHGGQINAHRHYPRGCRVVFTLPVKPVSPALPYRERE